MIMEKIRIDLKAIFFFFLMYLKSLFSIYLKHEQNFWSHNHWWPYQPLSFLLREDKLDKNNLGENGFYHMQ